MKSSPTKKSQFVGVVPSNLSKQGITPENVGIDLSCKVRTFSCPVRDEHFLVRRHRRNVFQNLNTKTCMSREQTKMTNYEHHNSTTKKLV